jgi:hypothetical protein
MNKKIRVFDSDNEELGPLFLAPGLRHAGAAMTNPAMVMAIK